MTAYITLFKFTQQGIANVKESPDRVKKAAAMLKQMGGRMIGAWWTMGEYDFVTVTEGPDDATAALATLMIVRAGNVTSVSMKAFDEEEFAQIVAKLP
jgi:uncharacterized protein with GYD domain